MAARRPAIATDLYFGAVSGFGLSALIWSLISSPVLLDLGVLAFVALGALLGSRRLRIGRHLRLSPVGGVSLAALACLGLGPAVAVAGAAALRSSIAGGRQARCGPLREAAFTFGAAAISTTFGGLVYLALGGTTGEPLAGRLALPATGYLCAQALIQTCLVAQAVSLISPRRALRFPPSHVVRSLTALTVEAAAALGIVVCYQASLVRPVFLLTPAVWLVLRLGRAQERRARRRERAWRPSQSIYRSIARGLSRGSATRDPSTHLHLRRVEDLCRGIARGLELSRDEKEALAAAAALLEIGDIAIDGRAENCSASRGDEDRGRVVAHPGVATEIVRAIDFPYPVEPIIRHRQERWDGRGYPDGLEGNEIPIGARILAAADAFVTLTRDTTTGRGLSVIEAIAGLRGDAGRCFDPDVVDRLVECALAHERLAELDSRSEEPAPASESAELPELTSAERRLGAMYEIETLAKRALPLEERLTLIADRVRDLVAYSSFVVYRCDDRRNSLRPIFARGLASGLLLEQTLTAACLSGRAAFERRSFFGEVGNDGSMTEPWHAEFDLPDDDGDLGRLRSYIVAPLVTENGGFGALALYDLEGREFTATDRQVLVQVAGHLVEALSEGDVQHPTDPHRLTDPLTGLPNAHYLRLEAALRIGPTGQHETGFGLLAFHLGSLVRIREHHGKRCADRMMSLTARRLAAACTSGETPVRFGQDQYLVLTPLSRAGELVRRWDDLRRVVGEESVEIDAGTFEPTGLVAAHACCPSDGGSLDALLSVLDTRLSLASESKGEVLPFRTTRTA